MPKYALYLRGSRVQIGTWRQCMETAIRYPDADWEIVDEETEAIVTRHYAIKQASPEKGKASEEIVERFIKGVKGYG